MTKADGANASQEQAVKNADADDSGLSGIAPLILFSLIGIVLIALAIRYFSQEAKPPEQAIVLPCEKSGRELTA